MKSYSLILLLAGLFLSCKNEPQKTPVTKPETPFVWQGANLYFLMTDRFNNGDPSNDVNFNRTKTPANLRGFEGGDLKGITQKINDGYFTKLGVNAIWMTPIVEQIHGAVDEGYGLNYGFHGYWTRDWTEIDPNFGTATDLKALVDAAHKRGIRVVLDAVINHTGPVTPEDSVWPQDWVRTEPVCQFTNFDNTVHCALVHNLPDIRTESNEPVELPDFLVKKWKAEGRYDQEMAELDAFFKKTGYPRAPRFYIMKWLSDYITDFGIDGYRCDTVKHTEPYVWEEFKAVCDSAFAEYKAENPDKVLDDNDFYLVGEVYGYGISGGKYFDFGDKKVNYFDNKFTEQINFEFKSQAAEISEDSLFSFYSNTLHSTLSGFGLLNYISSHDDNTPFDKPRNKPFESADKLLLSPGTSQIYYGDESARPLIIPGTEGDATLRSFMNWDSIAKSPKTKVVLEHWRKLGKFREHHPAVGAGVHKTINKEPFVFKRSFMQDDYLDKVVIGLDMPKGEKTLKLDSAFPEGSLVHDAYSDQTVKVVNDQVIVNSPYPLVLLEATLEK